MRKNIVAGNWKMNKNVIDAQQLMAQLLEYKKENATNCEVWIAPPALYLMMARDIFENNEVGVFSQDMSEFAAGASQEKSLQICYNLLKQTVLLSVTAKEDNTTEKLMLLATKK